MTRIQQSSGRQNGLTENAGRENDGPSKLQGMKLREKKSTVLTEIILQWSVQIFKPTTL